MARHIQTVIELSKSQTQEFLASLQNPANEKNRDETIRKAKETKFNIVL